MDMLCVQDWGDEGEQDEKQEDCQRSVGVRVKDKNRVSTTYERNVFNKRKNGVYTKDAWNISTFENVL